MGFFLFLSLLPSLSLLFLFCFSFFLVLAFFSSGGIERRAATFPHSLLPLFQKDEAYQQLLKREVVNRESFIQTTFTQPHPVSRLG